MIVENRKEFSRAYVSENGQIDSTRLCANLENHCH
jgi:hypothetical protein